MYLHFSKLDTYQTYALRILDKMTTYEMDLIYYSKSLYKRGFQHLHSHNVLMQVNVVFGEVLFFISTPTFQLAPWVISCLMIIHIRCPVNFGVTKHHNNVFKYSENF